MKPYFGIAKLSTLSLEELPGYPGISNPAGQKYFVEIYNSIKKNGVRSPIVVKQIKNVRHVLPDWAFKQIYPNALCFCFVEMDG